jgi:hypothetical protein
LPRIELSRLATVFLDQVVLLQSRAKGTIFILSYQHCHTVQTDLHHILRRFWTDFSTFNIILQTPCSCNGTKIYTFLPFERVDHSWGQTLSTNTQPKLVSKFHDLNQFPLQITMFSRYPYMIKPLPKALKDKSYLQRLDPLQEFWRHRRLRSRSAGKTSQF